VVPMRDTHKILFLGALAGGILYMVRRARTLERDLRQGQVDVFNEIPTLGPQLSRSDADVKRLDDSVAPTAPF
jgi:hypothetical protein